VFKSLRYFPSYASNDWLGSKRFPINKVILSTFLEIISATVDPGFTKQQSSRLTFR